MNVQLAVSSSSTQARFDVVLNQINRELAEAKYPLDEHSCSILHGISKYVAGIFLPLSLAGVAVFI